MNSIFNPDSGFMHFLNRFSSLVILNLLFLFTCIPVFTIGASLTAMYDVLFRMDTEREGKLVSGYFRAFSANFKQSTAVWLIFLLLIGASCANAIIFSNMDGTMGYLLFLISMVILINAMLVLGWVFPLMSQFDNSLGQTLKNALLLCVANLPRSLVMAVVNCFPWALMFMNLYTFIKIGFIWFVLYFSAAAYFNSRVLMKVFDPLRIQASSGK